MTPRYRVLKHGTLVMLRWLDTSPELSTTLADEICEHQSRAGGPLFLVVIVGPDCTLPDKQTREAMLRDNGRIHPRTAVSRMLILGNSPRQTLMRTLVTSMTLISGLAGRPFTVDKSVAALVSDAAAHAGLSSEELGRLMCEAELLEAEDLTA